ncbi:MAG: hypothetical protein KKA73_29260 [Chloroflexi bacterium]|nr:hypothetical protein [Chloroflexota bacterium]
MKKTIVLLALLGLLVLGLSPSATSAPTTTPSAYQPLPLVYIYDLPATTTYTQGLVEAPGPAGAAGAWVREHLPLGLAFVADDATPTGGYQLVEVMTDTLVPVTYTVPVSEYAGLYPVTYTFTTSDMVAIPIAPSTVSEGISEYRWPTATQQAAAMQSPQTWLKERDAPGAALAASWLGEPQAGWLADQAGLWVHRADGYIDFFDPTAAQITAFHVPAVYSVPVWSYLMTTPAGDAVWGGGWDLTVLYPQHGEAVRFEGAFAWPTAFAYATGTATSTVAVYADGLLGALVECRYDQGAVQPQVRAWTLPVTGEGASRFPTALEQKAVPDGQLWYLDRFNNELGHLTYDDAGGTVRLYTLPQGLVPYMQLSGPDAAGLLWFSVNNWQAGYAEIASFDTQTGQLTRYRTFSNAYPGTQGGAAGWAAAVNQVYRVLWRYLLYYPLVIIE